MATPNLVKKAANMGATSNSFINKPTTGVFYDPSNDPYAGDTQLQTDESTLSADQDKLKQLQSSLPGEMSDPFAGNIMGYGNLLTGTAGAISDLNSQISTLENKISGEKASDSTQSPLKKLASSQYQQAQDFQKQFPSLIDQQMMPYEDQARQSIASNLAGNNTAYNSRGLLYSGMRTGANANAGAGLPQELAGARYNANAKAQGLLGTMYQNAANTGLIASGIGSRYANVNNDLINSLIDVGMGQQGQAANAASNLVGSFGNAAGGALGSTEPSSVEQQIQQSPLSTVNNDNMYFNPTGGIRNPTGGMPNLTGLNPALSGYGNGLMNYYPSLIS